MDLKWQLYFSKVLRPTLCEFPMMLAVFYVSF